MSLIIGQNTYITVAQADSFFEHVIQRDIEKPWQDLGVTEKEKYIVTSFREISEVDYASIEKAEREQLRLLELIFLDYDEFYKRKHLRMSGVKKFKNKEWEEQFDMSDRAGDGAFGSDDKVTGNAVLSL